MTNRLILKMTKKQQKRSIKAIMEAIKIIAPPDESLPPLLEKYKKSRTKYGSANAINKVSALLDVNKQTLYNWVTGYSDISPENAMALEKLTKGKISRRELRPDYFDF